MNFQMFKLDLGTRDQIVNIRWIMEKAREFQKNIYFCFTDYAKAFDCADHNKLWKILKEMGIPDHLICLLRNLYVGQEAIVRTRHGTTDWFKIGNQAICCHPAYLTYMQNTSYEMPGWMKHKLESRWLGEISIIFANILKYADDTTFMAESEEELESFDESERRQ